MGEASDAGETRTLSLDPAEGGLSVPRLFFALLRQRFTGSLALDQPDPMPGRRTIWFRGGMPIFTDWVSPSDVLGEVLVQRGVVTATQLGDALQAMARDGGLLGQILVERSALDADGLAETLKEQCRRKLGPMFALTGGEVELVVGPRPEAGAGDLKGQVNVLSLILHGIGQNYDEGRVRGEMGEDASGDLVATPAFAKYQAQFGFRPDDARIVDAVARGTRFESLAVPGVSRDRVAQVVGCLWVCQMLRVGADATTAIAAGATAAGGQKTARPQESRPVAKAPARPQPPPAPKRPPTAASKAAEPSTTDTPSPKPTPPPTPKQQKAATKPSTPKPASDAAAPSSEFEAGLVALEAQIAGESHAFALFGLELDAGRKEVRSKWAELSKTYHPDGLDDELESLRERTESVFAALSEAYGVLGNKEQREQLAEIVRTGGTGRQSDAAAVVRNTFEADLIARDGDKLLKKGNYQRALEHYTRALMLAPDEPDIQAARAWCQFRLSTGEPAAVTEALDTIAAILEDQPKCARGHFYQGMVLLHTRNESAAKIAFQSALHADRRMAEAQQQLHAINIRLRERKKQSEKPPEKKLSLKGLFGRK